MLTDVYAPNGQRIQYQFDAKKRLEKIYRISDGKRIARWRYNPDWTIQELQRGNGLYTQSYYDQSKNVTRLRTANGSGTVFNLNYGYDQNDNVLYEDNTTESSWDETYTFDNANRLTEYKRGWYNGTSISNPSSQSAWTLDDLYNWDQYMKDGATQNRDHNLANEITQIDSTSVVHDDRGNLTDDGSKLYEWNIANQLVAVREKATNNILGQYAFDAFGRRIWKKVIATGEETDYFLTGNQVIEERHHTASTAVTYNFVWGQYIDELVCRYTTGVEHYPVQNRQYSTYRVFDKTGMLVEKYRYSPHGRVEFYAPAGTPRTSSAIGMTTMFTGRELDPESGMMYFRARMWSAQSGRFMQRDPIGYADGMNLYNGYFVPERVDPWGQMGAGTHPNPETGLEPTSYVGHSNLPGNDIFDYAGYDDKSIPAHKDFLFWTHFRDLSDVESDLQLALEECDFHSFEDFMHQGQDYFWHTYRRGWPGRVTRWIVHGLRGTAWDDPTNPANAGRLELTMDWTDDWYYKWKENCCLFHGWWTKISAIPGGRACCDK